MKIVFGLLVVAMVMFAGCESQQTTDQGVVVDSKYDSNLYTVTLEADDLTSHENFNLSGSMSMVNGFGTGSVSAWTDGKGILRGRLLDISPELVGFSVSDTIIVKTTDLKVKMIKDGDVIILKCVSDYEPVISQNQDTTVAQQYELWELDYCRLVKIKKAAE